MARSTVVNAGWNAFVAKKKDANIVFLHSLPILYFKYK